MAVELSVEEFSNNVNIKVIGVGGGGNNAVNRMIEAGVRGVEYIAMNTDAPVLNNSKASKKIAIGQTTTRGRGAGSDPKIGKDAAVESDEDIRAVLKDVQMVFITAGMGGGTGTGAAPVVAKIAKEMGILTIGIVTKPFKFEGAKRMKIAEEGISQLRECVDSLIVVPNQRLKEVSNEPITLQNAFIIADDVLRCGVQSISELVNQNGYVNLDFADVTAIMKDAGYAHMAIGSDRGENKATSAAQQAITSPLLETSIKGAKGIIINITASPDISLEETEQASELIANEVDPDAKIIWGVAFDNTLKNQMNITVIATGFDANNSADAPREIAADPTAQEAAPVAADPASTAPSPISDNDLGDLINLLNGNHSH